MAPAKKAVRITIGIGKSQARPLRSTIAMDSDAWSPVNHARAQT